MSYKYDEQNRMGASNRGSRYNNLRIITDLDTKIKFLETYERREIPESPDDYFHTVQPHEEYRLDLIAHQYYKNALLWWVIASANNMTNPLIGPKSGDIIRIPSIRTLYGNGGILL